jgi:hypothetical protein
MRQHTPGPWTTDPPMRPDCLSARFESLGDAQARPYSDQLIIAFESSRHSRRNRVIGGISLGTRAASLCSCSTTKEPSSVLPRELTKLRSTRHNGQINSRHELGRR